MQTIEIDKTLNVGFGNKRSVMTSDAKVVGKVYGALDGKQHLDRL